MARLELVTAARRLRRDKASSIVIVMLLGLGIAVAFSVSLIPGLINGWLIAHLRVPAFIGTLGMYGVARGSGFLAAGGTTVPVNNSWLFEMGNGKLLGVPVPVIITVVAVLILHYVLSQTRFGQYTYAIGGNRMAAIRSGINVRRHTMMIYVIAAGTAGLAGMIYTSRFSAGAAQAGEPMLLDSIAAVVIGGASLFGGSGTIIGTVIGALIIAGNTGAEDGIILVGLHPCPEMSPCCSGIMDNDGGRNWPAGSAATSWPAQRSVGRELR